MPPDSMYLKLLLCIFSGWVHRQQDQVIDYLVEENRVLREQLKSKRLGLTDSQRRPLATKAKILGTRMLSQVATIMTPDTFILDFFLTILSSNSRAARLVGCSTME